MTREPTLLTSLIHSALVINKKKENGSVSQYLNVLNSFQCYNLTTFSFTISRTSLHSAKNRFLSRAPGRHTQTNHLLTYKAQVLASTLHTVPLYNSNAMLRMCTRTLLISNWHVSDKTEGKGFSKRKLYTRQRQFTCVGPRAALLVPTYMYMCVGGVGEGQMIDWLDQTRTHQTLYQT